MSNVIAATKTQAEVRTMIAAFGEHEKLTRAMFVPLAFEVLAHAVEHGDISLVNETLPQITPANKTTLIRLVMETTEFAYSKKEGKFTGKDKALDSNDKAERARNLIKFIEQYKGDIFAWYEGEKADKDTAPAFNKAQLIRMLGLYLKEERQAEAKKAEAEGREPVEITFDAAVGELVAEVKADTEKALTEAEQIEIGKVYWIGCGMAAKDAERQAKQDVKNGIVREVKAA